MYYNAHQDAFPVAENLSSHRMNLPSWPGLSFEQVAYITRTICENLREEAIAFN